MSRPEVGNIKFKRFPLQSPNQNRNLEIQLKINHLQQQKKAEMVSWSSIIQGEPRPKQQINGSISSDLMLINLRWKKTRLLPRMKRKRRKREYPYIFSAIHNALYSICKMYKNNYNQISQTSNYQVTPKATIKYSKEDWNSCCNGPTTHMLLSIPHSLSAHVNIPTHVQDPHGYGLMG